MGRVSRFTAGLAGAMLIGGGGGYALVPLAVMDPSSEAPGSSKAAAPSSRVLVVDEVEGHARATSPAGGFRVLKAGDTIERPTVLVAEDRGSSVTVSLSGARIRVERDARVLFSAPGPSLQLQLDRGLVLVHSRVFDVSVWVPAEDVVIRGGVFGAWLRRGRVEASVIDGEISTTAGGSPEKYPRGQVVVLEEGRASSLPIPTRLEIELERIDRARGGYAVDARTSPYAVAFVRLASGAQEIEASASGAFTATLDRVPPAEGALVVYDGAGRRAQVGQPSGTLDDVLASLSKEREPSDVGPAAQPRTRADPGDAEKPRELSPTLPRGRADPRDAGKPLPPLSDRAAKLLGERSVERSGSVPPKRGITRRRESAPRGARTASSASAEPKAGDGASLEGRREPIPEGGAGEPPARPPEREEKSEDGLKEVEVE